MFLVHTNQFVAQSSIPKGRGPWNISHSVLIINSLLPVRFLLMKYGRLALVAFSRLGHELMIESEPPRLEAIHDDKPTNDGRQFKADHRSKGETTPFFRLPFLIFQPACHLWLLPFTHFSTTRLCAWRFITLGVIVKHFFNRNARYLGQIEISIGHPLIGLIKRKSTADYYHY